MIMIIALIEPDGSILDAAWALLPLAFFHVKPPPIIFFIPWYVDLLDFLIKDDDIDDDNVVAVDNDDVSWIYDNNNATTTNNSNNAFMAMTLRDCSLKLPQ